MSLMIVLILACATISRPFNIPTDGFNNYLAGSPHELVIGSRTIVKTTRR